MLYNVTLMLVKLQLVQTAGLRMQLLNPCEAGHDVFLTMKFTIRHMHMSSTAG